MTKRAEQERECEVNTKDFPIIGKYKMETMAEEDDTEVSSCYIYQQMASISMRGITFNRWRCVHFYIWFT
jgi:hypothetical protein